MARSRGVRSLRLTAATAAAICGLGCGVLLVVARGVRVSPQTDLWNPSVSHRRDASSFDAAPTPPTEAFVEETSRRGLRDAADPLAAGLGQLGDTHATGNAAAAADSAAASGTTAFVQEQKKPEGRDGAAGEGAPPSGRVAAMKAAYEQRNPPSDTKTGDPARARRVQEIMNARVAAGHDKSVKQQQNEMQKELMALPKLVAKRTALDTEATARANRVGAAHAGRQHQPSEQPQERPEAHASSTGSARHSRPPTPTHEEADPAHKDQLE